MSGVPEFVDSSPFCSEPPVTCSEPAVSESVTVGDSSCESELLNSLDWKWLVTAHPPAATVPDPNIPPPITFAVNADLDIFN